MDIVDDKPLKGVILLCILFCMLEEIEPKFVELSTSAGRLIGLNQNIQQTSLNVFLGIPYAEKPIGDKRFSRPIIKEPWTYTINATTQPNSCYQSIDTAFDRFEGVEMWNPNTKISEDCLYLNLYVPSDRPNNKLRPVVVWIYGGSFAFGTVSLPIYDGRIMASVGDVVFVAMQYRVGPLGFLYLGNEDVPGNMGLLDQNMALQWIYKHIESFGGDTNRITLFGESAGAVSAALHQISELSRPMVNNIILQSASSIPSWAVDEPVYAQSQAIKLARSLNCEGDDMKEITQCLKAKDAQEITDNMWSIGHNKDLTLPFAPVLDNYFLTDYPSNIIYNDNSILTNSLVGFNSNEGTYFLFYEGYVNGLEHEHLSKSHLLQNMSCLLKTENKELIDLVTFQYEDDDGSYDDDKNYIDVLDQVLGDSMFSCGVTEFADQYIGSGKDVYMYVFNHRTSANPWPEWAGVMHGYEIDHIFGAPLNKSISYSEQERLLSLKMLKYWTNFAKSG